MASTTPQWYRDQQAERLELLRHRANLREQAYEQDSPDEALDEKITDLSQKLLRQRKKNIALYKTARKEAIYDAWSQREFASVHKHSRKLAVTTVGTKKRVFNTMNATNPSSDEWARFLSLRGSEGGLGARVVPPPLDDLGTPVPTETSSLDLLGMGRDDYDDTVLPFVVQNGSSSHPSGLCRPKCTRCLFFPATSASRVAFAAVSTPTMPCRGTSLRKNGSSPSDTSSSRAKPSSH